MTATPAIEGWFTTGDEPALLGSRCTTCETVFFPHLPAEGGFCRNPVCDGQEFDRAELSRRGRVWSYTDAQYQPPPPYVSATETFEPFALAAVELPEGLVVLGQVAAGHGVDDLTVGDEVELVVEELVPGELIWRWKPTGSTGTNTEGSAA